jgi:hypothetical protein
MKTVRTLSQALLAVVCAGLTFTSTRLNADSRPQGNPGPVLATAGVTASLIATSDPFVSKATATGVVQSPQLGTCVENAELEARFPVDPNDPVVLNGTGTFTSIKGTDSLNFTVSGTASPDPASPFFYNAKYVVTFTGGTGKYAAAKGLAEISEVIMFTSDATATVTWTLKGFVVTPQ